MRVIRIDLEYEGTDFRGFAPQPGARTVGGELEAVEAMHHACELLVGRHDFAAFRTHRTQDPPQRGTLRRVLAAQWRRDAGNSSIVRFEIEADAFLRHMVRTIVGSAILVGHGKLPASALGAMLVKGERAEAGPTAPALGLSLLEVKY